MPSLKHCLLPDATASESTTRWRPAATRLERFFDVSSDLMCIGGPECFRRVNPTI